MTLTVATPVPDLLADIADLNRTLAVHRDQPDHPYSIRAREQLASAQDEVATWRRLTAGAA